MGSLLILAGAALKQWKWILIGTLVVVVTSCGFYIKHLRASLAECEMKASTLEQTLAITVERKDTAISSIRTQAQDCLESKGAYNEKRSKLNSIKVNKVPATKGQEGKDASRYSGYVDFFNSDVATD